MQKQHWIALIVVAIVFYFVGSMYPSYGTMALNKVGL